ncbi:hypothetical protein [Microbacterium thalli]|uniref:Uncharacterized protein n=1 Tax=Microbacterium thalli TaxID=3027921 RepID=A0ABT5SIQ9_9MICO|nr:hypothetical protein [Microbacterium thalli]MDD7962667.1 hypothetical protein [Microbacterium thalli]MDN8547682.1 hypothetical protein [Microbacterium thalli]
MGLFMQRPEEPSEWAGLPSEPVRRKSDAELLPDEPPAAAPAGDLLGGGGIASIAIPITIPTAREGQDVDGDGGSTSDGEPPTV